MTVTRGLALFLTSCARRRARSASPAPAADADAAPSAQLKAISARVNAQGRVARHRGERAGGVRRDAARSADRAARLPQRRRPTAVANAVVAEREEPDCRACRSKPAESLGAPAARVRIALAQPVAHRVRSDRNTVVVDFEKPSAERRRTCCRRAPRRPGRAGRHAGARRARRPRRSDRRARPRRAAPADRPPRRRRRCGRVAPPHASGPAPAPQRAAAAAAGLPAPAPDQVQHRAQRPRSSPGNPSASTSRAPTCAPCCARSPRSAA